MTTELKKQLREACPSVKILKVGKWEWIYFEAKPSDVIRTALKEAKAHWNARRKCWQLSNGYSRRMYSKAGSQAVLRKYRAVELEE